MNKTVQPILLIFLLIILLFVGCNKEDSMAFTDSPIIEAYLEPGSYLTVQVNRQIPFSTDVDYSSDDINNLALSLTYNNVTHMLMPTDSGRYVDSSILIKEGDAFNLSFTFNSKSVNAYTYIPSKPTDLTQSAYTMYVPRMDSASGPPTGTMSDPVDISWTNTDDSYYLMVIENMEATLDPIRDFGDAEPPGNRFRKSPTNSSFESIRPMEFQYFGTHRIILFHVLPDYASLYEQNGSSSQNLTNPSTSITNAYGIFTGLNSDTLYMEVKDSSK
ncbi:MAG: DUF4249 family protein [Lentimicrobium sp.]|nr:DUF4249 family protein [Lentimicrobium sp.]